MHVTPHEENFSANACPHWIGLGSQRAVDPIALPSGQPSNTHALNLNHSLGYPCVTHQNVEVGSANHWRPSRQQWGGEPSNMATDWGGEPSNMATEWQPRGGGSRTAASWSDSGSSLGDGEEVRSGAERRPGAIWLKKTIYTSRLCVCTTSKTNKYSAACRGMPHRFGSVPDLCF